MAIYEIQAQFVGTVKYPTPERSFCACDQITEREREERLREPRESESESETEERAESESESERETMASTRALIDWSSSLSFRLPPLKL
ncbi:hypothetical protein RHMOL_Rhmol11G0161200 [Rhododendron molle]|uniref:Uncharacterized protein n=1 Tax=Rhododendron molle TaxID=49168 RepID=A0ACC0LTD2_RHOML|nr:hypothetical protein RHMOL_Rhmol11G0161200 [Rhododendron molle]